MTRQTKPQKYDQYFPKPEGKETKGKEREEKEGRKEEVNRKKRPLHLPVEKVSESGCSKFGLLFVVECGLLVAVACPVAELGL